MLYLKSQDISAFEYDGNYGFMTARNIGKTLIFPNIASK
jgi:hypothetical protein